MANTCNSAVLHFTPRKKFDYRAKRRSKLYMLEHYIIRIIKKTNIFS